MSITIPGAVIPRLRIGTHLQLARDAQRIDAVASAWDKDDPPDEARASMDRAWALIDLLGWAGAVPESIEVDAHDHGATLRVAIGHMAANLTEIIADRAVDGSTKAERTGELRALREFESRLLEAMGR
jgi:hypothetical protein